MSERHPLNETPSMPMPAARAKSFLIVGAHFRPPAKALCALLPAGATVWLLPEPSNPYDAHAVKVLVNFQEFLEAVRQDLEAQSLGYGHDLQSLAEGEAQANADMAMSQNTGWWHLGYIPAQKPGKNGEPESADEIVWNMDLIPADGCSGVIAFEATGKPIVRVSPWPPHADGVPHRGALANETDDTTLDTGNSNWGDGD